MPFVRRAKTYYASDEIIKAVVTLIEGLKRFPENTEAFRWLLDLYCEEGPHTGLEEDLVTIEVYNMIGQRVAKLLDKKNMSRGQHRVPFDATQMSSGLYFYQVITTHASADGKMLLLR